MKALKERLGHRYAGLLLDYAESIATIAQAVFLKKHGKEAFLQVQDALHKSYDFKKVQEILGENLEDAIKILESCI